MYNFETISSILWLQYYNMYNRAKIMCTILVIFHNIYVHIVRNIYFGIVHIIVRVVQYEINIAYKFVHDILWKLYYCNIVLRVSKSLYILYTILYNIVHDWIADVSEEPGQLTAY